MDTCDVLIVGGGPAGSSCAWALRESGLDVLIVDRATFPREKLCGGWITPLVLLELGISPSSYGFGRTLQPISGFRIGTIGDPGTQIDSGGIVSYGIRRCEFDHYLLLRSGARVRQGYAVQSIERIGDAWLVNGEVRARMLVGAGGHFCPVTRMARDTGKPQPVVAREIEFEMSSAELNACGFRGEVPELYFCRDMKGYGWCFRKGRYLNIGLGRVDPHRLPEHVERFVLFLIRDRRLDVDRKLQFAGHAYFLFGHSARNLVDDSLVLVGDAAGLAFAQSGEGIRPAIESGLIAAHVIADAEGDYSSSSLQRYMAALQQRYGSANGIFERSAQFIPTALRNAAARRLLRNPRFCRFVVENWFLREDEAPLAAPPAKRVFEKSA